MRLEWSCFMCFLISCTLQNSSSPTSQLMNLLQLWHVKALCTTLLWSDRFFRVQNFSAQASQVWLDLVCLYNKRLSWKAEPQSSHLNCSRELETPCYVFMCISSLYFLTNWYPHDVHVCFDPKCFSFSCLFRLFSVVKHLSHLSHEQSLLE